MILYDDIFQSDIALMNEVLRKYGTGDKAWEIFYEFYQDPDGYPINDKGFRTKQNIKCTKERLQT